MTALSHCAWLGSAVLCMSLLAGCSDQAPLSGAKPPEPNNPLQAGTKQGPGAGGPTEKLKPGERVAMLRKAVQAREEAVYEEARKATLRLNSAPDKLQPSALNVVLLTVDTLRFDDTGGFGSKLETSPAIAALAKQGVRFANAISPGPWTVPAMYSLITGMYPTEHGITGGIVSPMGNRILGQPVLSQAAMTIAERLKALGYGTFGVCTNFHLSAKYGYAQGFDMFVGQEFDVLPFPNFAAESFLPLMRKFDKYFLWVHYFDPHAPYKVQSPWFTQWNESPYDSVEALAFELTAAYYRGKANLGDKGPIFPPHAVPIKKLALLAATQPVMLNLGLSYLKAGADSEPIKFLRAAHRSEIRATDQALGRLLEKLGIGENTLVIVVADHGEEFMEHGHMDHRLNGSVYHELIHVPMLMVLPGRKHAGKVIDTPVSTMDIMATIMDVLGQPIEGQTSGRSLLPLIEGKPFETRPVYTELHEVRLGEFRAILEYPWKYIHAFKTGTGQLFDLSKDPTEKSDLAATETERAAAMKKKLLEWTASLSPQYPTTAPVPISPEEMRRLKAMGYMQ
ncbi:MAG: sulfatase [Myxococcota bacterium]|jgi:arylsulfatase A-like enzyme|nr:sulfatase [Myxococcota bacterium]